MRRSTLVAFLFAGGISSSALAAVPILTGPITNPANGRLYYLLDKSTWPAAEAQAVTMGGHLATVRNSAENAFIFNTFSHFNGEPRDLWIGLTDEGHEGTFTWTSGAPFSFANFQTGQPDNGAGAGAGPENYVEMNTQRGSQPHVAGWVDGRWNDFLGNVDSYTYFGGIATQNVDGVVETPEPGISMLGCTLIALTLGRRRSH